MGAIAKINSDLRAMDSIRYFSYDHVQKNILDMSYQDYKEYCFGVLQKEKESFNRFVRNNPVSKKAQQVKSLQNEIRLL